MFPSSKRCYCCAFAKQNRSLIHKYLLFCVLNIVVETRDTTPNGWIRYTLPQETSLEETNKKKSQDLTHGLWEPTGGIIFCLGLSTACPFYSLLLVALYHWSGILLKCFVQGIFPVDSFAFFKIGSQSFHSSFRKWYMCDDYFTLEQFLPYYPCMQQNGLCSFLGVIRFP